MRVALASSGVAPEKRSATGVSITTEPAHETVGAAGENDTGAREVATAPRLLACTAAWLADTEITALEAARTEPAIAGSPAEL